MAQFLQKIAHRPTKILTAGSSGTGKTTFLLQYVRGSWHDFVFVFDHQSEIAQRLEFPYYAQLEKMAGAVAQEIESPRGRRIFIYDPSDEFPGAYEQAFDAFCEWVFEAATQFGDRESLVITDEIQQITGPQMIPDPLKVLLQTGRRRGIDVHFGSQAPNEIHNTIRNQCTELICFGLLDKNSLKFANECGFDTDEVSRLTPGNYVAWSRSNFGFTRGNIFSLDTQHAKVQA